MINHRRWFCAETFKVVGWRAFNSSPSTHSSLNHDDGDDDVLVVLHLNDVDDHFHHDDGGVFAINLLILLFICKLQNTNCGSHLLIERWLWFEFPPETYLGRPAVPPSAKSSTFRQGEF